jgi:hypothetical protein
LSFGVLDSYHGTRRGQASVHAELAIHVRKQPLAPETEAPGINDIVDLKPNFMGFGVNLNALIKRYWAKFRKRKPNQATSADAK